MTSPGAAHTGAILVGSYRYLTDWNWGVEHWLADHNMGGELACHREKMLDGISRRLTAAQTLLPRVSVHGPATIPPPGRVVETLNRLGADIVVHAAALGRRRRWRSLGERLLVENMDRRGTGGRTTTELQDILKTLPDARICLDVSHTFDHSPTGELCRELTAAFKGRIGEVHVGCGRGEDRSHTPISRPELELAVQVARHEQVPLVIERTYTPSELEDLAEELQPLIQP